MRIPVPPSLARARQISPSLYEQMLRCPALAAWSLLGIQNALPAHPKAILGICYHGTIEDAHAGRIGGDNSTTKLDMARRAFDAHARGQHAKAHPLLKAKFSTAERLPYYTLFRERAALEAIGVVESAPRSVMGGQAFRFLTAASELRIESRDKLIAGRPDFVDAASRRVVDYKTGGPPSPGADPISPAESRQLRLYAHLAIENGIEITEGVIRRSDGRRATIAISQEDAATEGRAARQMLAQFNAAAGSAFTSAARPACGTCTYCPCIPLCEAFWASATPGWVESCGVHVEGTVRSIDESIVQGIRLKTFRISATRGTIQPGDAFVEQVPEAWVTADGAAAPAVGDLIRVAFARADTSGNVTSIRIDRISTSIWSRVHSDESWQSTLRA